MIERLRGTGGSSLYAAVGEQCFSMVVASTHDGETVITSEAIREPRAHP
jgi:hypothetical protein